MARTFTHGTTRIVAVAIAYFFGILTLLFAGQQIDQQQLQLFMGESGPQKVWWAGENDFDGSILFCRGQYNSDRFSNSGSGWWTDYPGADHNFLVRLSELTDVRVRFDENRIPFFVVLKLDDPLIHKCPIFMMSDPYGLVLQDAEIQNLKHYFARGGFLWVDDFWGQDAWDRWEFEIRKVLPSGPYRMIDIPNGHMILNMLYHVPRIWQMPHVDHWYTTSGETSELGLDSLDPSFRAIVDEDDHILVVMTHNTDIADGWEEEGPPHQQAYLDTFSARSYALGINIYLYALTH